MGRVLCSAVAALLLLAVPASADETITAIAPNQFLSDVTTIDQGEKVTFENLDLAGHDVTSIDRGPDGSSALFSTPLTSPLGIEPVAGTEYLTSGSYHFICTVHPGMEADLEVTSAGKPVPRPGGGGKPKITVKILSKKLSRVRKDGAIKLSVSAGSPTTVKLTATLKKAKLGSASVELPHSGPHPYTLKLSKAGRKALRDADKATIKISASGGGGAKGSARRTLG